MAHWVAKHKFQNSKDSTGIQKIEEEKHKQIKREKEDKRQGLVKDKKLYS